MPTVVYLIRIFEGNQDLFNLLCECMGWEWRNVQNDNYKAIMIQNTPPMLRLFKKLNGCIYSIKEGN